MHAFEITVQGPIQDVEEVVRAALETQGFGVLTEIDVAATLRTKLGVERPPLKILGACNPSFAHRALEIDPTVSLFLPCNVVIESTEEGIHVAVADPRDLMSGPAFESLTDEAAAKLEAVVTSLRSNATPGALKEQR